MDLNISTEQFIRDVTETLITSMTNEIRQQVVRDVTSHVMNFDLRSEIQNQIDQAVTRAIQSYAPIGNDGRLEPFQNNPVTGYVFNNFKTKTDAFLDTMVSRVQERVIDDLSYRLNTLDVTTLVQEQADATVKNILQNHNYNFPDHSIPGQAINPVGIKINPGDILPGQIKQFESTGIQDYASRLQLTILDDATIFENKLVTNSLDVAGDIVIKGSVNKEFTENLISEVISKFESKYNDGVYDQYCNRVIDYFKNTGLDSAYVKVEGQAIVVGEKLNQLVTDSNLQNLGILKKLVVNGETLLDNTVYVSSRRLGINTRDPERVLDIWDQEVQIVASKRLKDVGFIGTLRNQNLILGANNKDNLVLNADGSITVSQMILGKIHHSSAQDRPADNKPVGYVVWNERPVIGGPVGWVSLGGARWAKFGLIQDN